MKIITTHERTDMDALASIYAASLLHPDYQPVLPQNLNRNLRDFLALYKDELPFVSRGELPRERISHLLLVDAQAVASLPSMDSHTRTHIIDHHELEEPLAESSKAASPSVTFEGEPLGATATLLIEKIRRSAKPHLGRDAAAAIGRVGATLLLMGIYEDTGSLSYVSTTARDVQAAAWALEQGADLALAIEFLHRPLSNGQRDALSRLAAGSTIYTIRERSVCIAEILLDEYVDELSTLAHQLMDMYEPEACFMLAQHERKVQIIARSTTNAIDVAALLRNFGGGGHTKASAALVRDAAIAEVRARLLAALEEQVEPPVLVRDIMFTSAHTVNLDMSVGDAARLMRRYGHEGFPVVEGERLVGILTRRDIDRALHHGLDDTPVRRFLHTGPFHVLPNDPVDQVQREMIEHDLGQVPVVEDGRFVGIVTRTDLIKLWALVPSESRAKEIRLLLKDALPQPLMELLLVARDVANGLGYSLYIVGGLVRDLLVGAPNLDLDLVVEGDAIRLARKLASKIGGRVRSHSRFGTAKVIFEEERPGDSVMPSTGLPPSLDFVTARTEFYERPTVLPQVERSSIKQDLYRRDFTINTMAICLDRDRFGELLDYYGGERDLREGCIRVLHNLSFVEDPTRILRAVRFEQRLGFVIEPRTDELIDEALELLNHVTGERLRHELYLLLSEAEPERILERLDRRGALSQVDPHLRYFGEMSELFVRLRQRFSKMRHSRHAWPAEPRDSASVDDGEETYAPALCLCYLALLTSSTSRDELESFVEHLHISQADARLLYQVASLRESLNLLKTDAMLRSTIHRLLHPYSREARFVLSVLTDSRLVRERLDLYEQELSRVSPRIDGHYLKSLHLPPGPIYGEILARVRRALLDQEIATLEEEQALAQRLVRASHGELA